MVDCSIHGHILYMLYLPSEHLFLCQLVVRITGNVSLFSLGNMNEKKMSELNRKDKCAVLTYFLLNRALVMPVEQ